MGAGIRLHYVLWVTEWRIGWIGRLTAFVSRLYSKDKGEIVVDLVGGWQDKAMVLPYEFGTIHAVHSSGKTLVGTFGRYWFIC